MTVIYVQCITTSRRFSKIDWKNTKLVKNLIARNPDASTIQLTRIKLRSFGHKIK